MKKMIIVIVMFVIIFAITNIVKVLHFKELENLITLLDVANASATGEHECKCVKCPEEEFGCLYYDYNDGKHNDGYINDEKQSHFCPGYEGRGWIEEHAIREGVECD